jgi:protein-tyrosine kinase
VLSSDNNATATMRLPVHLIVTDMNDLNRYAEDPDSDGFDVHHRRRRELAKEGAEQVVALRREHRSRGGPSELRSQQFHYPFNVPGTNVQTLSDELVAAKEPFSDRAEEFRSLRGGLVASVFNLGKRALAVVSAEEGVGKTYLVSNLAISFSQFAGRTLLIDANLRTPRLHRLFGTTSEVGLSDLLAGDVKGEPVVSVDGLEGLHFLAAGSAVADPVKLLQGARFSVLLEQMADSFDFVLIDTPSNEVGPEARLIAARAGAALLVGRKGHSRIALLRQLLAQLNTGPSLMAGVVLNQH